MNENQITNKYIADNIDKSLDTVNGWKQRQPKLLELVKLGAFCKKNDLDIEKIKKLVEVQEAVKGVSE
ncbi:MAG: hypothetical protein Q9M40_07215 [Sulfurimonas sp.]|nr:hypothetical protein [Sulfurimonas sp.]